MRFSRSDYLHYKENLKGASDLASHYSTSVIFMSADNKGFQVYGSAVSANFFSLLGVNPAVGRFFLPDEDSPGRNSVAVLSHALWNREFSADPNIVGKQIKLNGTIFTVIGVVPETFRGIVAADTPNDVWILSSSSTAYIFCDVLRPECRFMDLVGRLAKGSSIEHLQAEMDVLAQQLDALRPILTGRENSPNKRSVAVMPQLGVGTHHRDDLTKLLNLLRNAALVLLLIACVNVSGLSLVQMAARTKEMSLRLALGSNQRQLYFQMITEGMLLSLLGGVGGVLIAFWLRGTVSRFRLTGNSDLFAGLHINTSFIIFTAALVMLCAIIATIIPAIALYRTDLLTLLKKYHSGGSSKTSRTHDALIIAQIALTLALVAGGGLLSASLGAIQSGPGFDLSRLAFFSMRPAQIGFSFEKSRAVLREVHERLSTIPGVDSASLSLYYPVHLVIGSGGAVVSLPGRIPEREEDKLRAASDRVGTKYLHTKQIPLVSGREFNDVDQGASSNVVIINESLAAQMFPNASAVGKALVIDTDEYTVIGVSKNAQYHLGSVNSAPFFYLPYWRQTTRADAYFLFRTAGDPTVMMPVIRRELLKIDPELPLSTMQTMREALKSEFPSVYLAHRVLLSACVIACFLSMLGLYSLIAFSIAKRNREIGIRIALGATRWNILRVAIQRGVVLATIGTVLGIGLSITSLHIFSSLLYGVKSTDPIVLITATILLISVSLIAGFLPAQRATRIDPIKAIRDE
jgi:predicted permease